ncbi:OsmC family protein [Reinekea sp.]|uniref:OsmC family protein n=1 Tax=Reinekea sp. TaxID=1970455 RepID=UPI002A7F8AAB|nr:OsmC family protein [Reinekea sp.]
MKTSLQWVGEKAFSYQSNSGYMGFIDGAAKDSADAKGPTPMELILVGLGGCTAYDVVSILQKARQDVVDCQIKLEAERATTVPAVFTKIHIHFLVSGRKLKETQVLRAIDLSAEKYCSASLMLERGGVEISHSHELIEVS